MGEDGTVYVTVTENHAIRRITTTSVVPTLAGQPGLKGHADGTGSATRFDHPEGIALDVQGALYVAEAGPLVFALLMQRGLLAVQVKVQAQRIPVPKPHAFALDRGIPQPFGDNNGPAGRYFRRVGAGGIR